MRRIHEDPAISWRRARAKRATESLVLDSHTVHLEHAVSALSNRLTDLQAEFAREADRGARTWGRTQVRQFEWHRAARSLKGDHGSTWNTVRALSTGSPGAAKGAAGRVDPAHGQEVRRERGYSSADLSTGTAPRGPCREILVPRGTRSGRSQWAHRVQRGAARGCEGGPTRLTIRTYGESAAFIAGLPGGTAARGPCEGIMGPRGTHRPGALSKFTGCKRGVRRRLDPAHRQEVRRERGY
jgi:hypothetical protein